MNALNTRTDCPRCAIPMNEVEGRGGVRVDHCERCGGAWYDAGEFERSYRVDGQLDLLAEGSQKILTMPCPRCERSLVELSWPPGSGVRVDACPGCRGLWLDAGEAARIKQSLVRAGRITDITEPPAILRGPEARTTVPVDAIHELGAAMNQAGLRPAAIAGAALLGVVMQAVILGFFQGVRLLRMVGDAPVSDDASLALVGQLVALPVASAIFVRLSRRADLRELGLGLTVAVLAFALLSPVALSVQGLVLVLAVGLPLSVLVGRLGLPL